MLNFITNLFRTKFLEVITKVKLSDITNNTEKALNKALQKKDKLDKESTNKTKTEKKTIYVRSEKQWHNWFPFVMFYGNGKIQPIYVFVTIFCSLSAWMLYIKTNASRMAVKIAIENKTFNYEMLSEIIPSTDLGIVLGFVSTLILLYNSNKNKSQNNGN
jgi:hypothetical protein